MTDDFHEPVYTFQHAPEALDGSVAKLCRILSYSGVSVVINAQQRALGLGLVCVLVFGTFLLISLLIVSGFSLFTGFQCCLGCVYYGSTGFCTHLRCASVFLPVTVIIALFCLCYHYVTIWLKNARPLLFPKSKKGCRPTFLITPT